jgi:TP53 regulating kinase-like protein
MLIKKGAEASLYLEDWHGRKVILKKRLTKRYRVPELDREIQNQRTRHEPQIMHKAKEAGVPTPIIFLVDLEEATIVMEFVEGTQVKHVLNDLPPDERKRLCRHIGELVGKLHSNGIVHGDLTTSNMILTPLGEVVLIDFGLSEQTMELEARGVDLHLMKRAIASTHFMHAEECFSAVIAGYEIIMGKKTTDEVLGKIAEIERRGRYISGR